MGLNGMLQTITAPVNSANELTSSVV